MAKKPKAEESLTIKIELNLGILKMTVEKKIKIK